MMAEIPEREISAGLVGWAPSQQRRRLRRPNILPPLEFIQIKRPWNDSHQKLILNTYNTQKVLVLNLIRGTLKNLVETGVAGSVVNPRSDPDPDSIIG